MEFSIEKYVMLIMNSKREKNGRNKNAKSRKNQNDWRESKVEVVGNIRSGYHQLEMTEKIKKIASRTNVKTSRNHALQQKLHQRNKHHGSLLFEILWGILKMVKRGTQRK